MRTHQFFMLVYLMAYLPYIGFSQSEPKKHTFKQVGNTAEAPFSFVVNLNYDVPGETSINATGFFISPRHILTNAHVVSRAKNLRIYPGATVSATGDFVSPFGFEAISKDQISIPEKFIYFGYLRRQLKRQQWDYALITLPDDSMAKKICACSDPQIPFELLPWLQLRDSSVQAVLVGYPISKKAEPQLLERRQQYDTRTIYRNKLDKNTPNIISYNEPGKATFGGDSGAPIWIDTTDARKKVIILHGYTSAGIVIHADMYKDLLKWGVPLLPLADGTGTD